MTNSAHVSPVGAEFSGDSPYRPLADITPALLWMTDPENQTVYFNQSWLSFTGRTLEQELGFGWWNGIHHDDRESAFNTFQDATRARQPFTLDYRLRRHDGEFRWLRDTGVPRYENDVYMGYVGSCIDITDQKQVEVALMESERFARATVDALSAHIAIIDEHGVIVAVNKAWRDFASNNQPIRSNVHEGANYLAVCERTTGPEAAAAHAFARGIRAVLRGETPEYSLEYPCHSPVEQRWFNARVTRFDDNGPLRVVISHENITKRRLLEDSTRSQNEIIETVNRIGQALSAELDLQKLLQAVTNAAAEVTHAQAGVFFYNLHDGDRRLDRFTTVATSASEAGRFAALRSTPLFDAILENAAVVRSDNLHKDLRFAAPLTNHPVDLPMVSLLAVPVRSREGELLGGLFLGHSRPAMFGLREEQLAVGLASQASIALDNARLHRATQQQAKQYEVTLASIGDAVIATDQHGRVTFINAVARQMTGWNCDALGKQLETVFEIVNEDTLEPVENPVEKVMRTGAIVGLANHTTLIARDGRTFPIDDSGAPIRSDDGEITGVVLVFRDVSDRKAIETRLRFLVDVNLALTASLDYTAALQQVTALVVPRLADWCVVHVVDDHGSIHAAAESHAEPRTRQLVAQVRQHYPNNMAFGHRQVLRTGTPMLVSRVDPATLARASQDDQHLSLLTELGLTSHLCVPILSARGCLGTLTFASTRSERLFDEGDLLLAEELAQRISMAMENTRLYETERRARRDAEKATARISLLQSITAALSEAVTPAQVAEVIVEQALYSLGGQFGVVSLLSDDGAWLDAAAMQGNDSARFQPRTSVDANHPLNTAVRIGQPIWVESGDDLQLHFPLAGTIPGRGASASLPLIANGRVIGGIGLTFNGDRSFSAEDRAFLVALAQQCAQAVQRAQLFADEHRARNEAERANALKLKFLAMISHELRTPLTSIKGFATTLLASDVTFDADDQRQFLQIIDDEADKLAELVDQLMDLSRLQAGTLGIRPERQPVSTIFARAMTQLSTLTCQHRLRIDLPDTLPRIVADAQRVAQVLVNLVGNAVKFAPENSEIVIRARRQGDTVQIDVTDDGPGIPQEAHAYVFEAFRQVDNGSPWPKKGAGLGLAICKGLVEAHGGVVWIEKAVERGTTISFTLPVAHAADSTACTA